MGIAMALDHTQPPPGSTARLPAEASGKPEAVQALLYLSESSRRLHSLSAPPNRPPALTDAFRITRRRSREGLCNRIAEDSGQPSRSPCTARHRND